MKRKNYLPMNRRFFFVELSPFLHCLLLKSSLSSLDANYADTFCINSFFYPATFDSFVIYQYVYEIFTIKVSSTPVLHSVLHFPPIHMFTLLTHLRWVLGPGYSCNQYCRYQVLRIRGDLFRILPQSYPGSGSDPKR